MSPRRSSGGVSHGATGRSARQSEGAIVNQGQGNGTRKKERFIQACLRQSLTISMGMKRHTYVHLELTSGSGWNEEAGCDGSPVEFARLAIGMGRVSSLLCCDIDRQRVEALEKRLGEFPWPQSWPLPRVVCQDNALFLPLVGNLLTAQAGCSLFGTLVCDPNGPGKGFPLAEIRLFATVHSRMDLILTFNLNAYRAWDPQRAKEGRDPEIDRRLRTMYDRYGTVEDTLRGLPREHWWVSNATMRGGTGNAYMVCLGRQMATKEPPCRDFVLLDSDEGRERMQRLRHHDEQKTLWPL